MKARRTFGGFEFDDHLLINEQVRPVARIRFEPFINDRQRELAFE